MKEYLICNVWGFYWSYYSSQSLIKIRGELDSSLETSLLSSFFRMFLSSYGRHWTSLQINPSSRSPWQTLSSQFPCPSSNLPISLLPNCLRVYEELSLSFFFLLSQVILLEFINTSNCFCTPPWLLPHHLHRCLSRTVCPCLSHFTIFLMVCQLLFFSPLQLLATERP